MLEILLSPLLGRRLTPPPEVADELRREGAVLREGSLIPGIGGLLAGMGRSAAAVTLGRTIVINSGARISERLIRHELQHVRQWQDPLFPLRYCVATLRYGYWDNPYEVEARSMEASHGNASKGEERTA